MYSSCFNFWVTYFPRTMGRRESGLGRKEIANICRWELPPNNAATTVRCLPPTLLACRMPPGFVALTLFGLRLRWLGISHTYTHATSSSSLFFFPSHFFGVVFQEFNAVVRSNKKKHRGRKKEETSVALRYHHHGKQRNTKTRETGAVFVSW